MKLKPFEEISFRGVSLLHCFFPSWFERTRSFVDGLAIKDTKGVGTCAVHAGKFMSCRGNEQKEQLKQRRKWNQFLKKGHDDVAIIHENHTQTLTLILTFLAKGERKDIELNETSKCMNAHQNNFFACVFSLLTSLKQKKHAPLNYSYASVCMWIIYSFCSPIHLSTYTDSFIRSLARPSNFNYFLKSFVCMCCKFTYTQEYIRVSSKEWAETERLLGIFNEALPNRVWCFVWGNKNKRWCREKSVTRSQCIPQLCDVLY